MKPSKKLLKRILYLIIFGFILANLVAYNHAWKFTHFADSSVIRTQDPKDLSFSQKLQTLFWGIDNPRPVNRQQPDTTFETVAIQSRKKLAGWLIKTANAKGTFILFHGYADAKWRMLERAKLLRQIGYNTLLIDFEGCGDSEGNETTVGYREADDVKAAFDFIKSKEEKPVFLLGTSMGAVAVLRAVAYKNINPQAIFAECPFGTMQQTVNNRFKLMKLPPFPFAGMLMFWGGIQTNFWAFSHNPNEYAKKITCPTLILYGEKDHLVTKSEVEQIFENLPDHKQLKTFPMAGHNLFVPTTETIKVSEKEWQQVVYNFLDSNHF
jgi:hypothetical protein